jgi:hypothetical protein
VVFPDAEYSIWIDGCLQLMNTAPDDLISKYLKDNDICVFRHKFRNCVYEELRACILQEKDDPDIMIRQVKRYHQEGYPRYNELAETTAVIRRHTKKVIEFNNTWWKEINAGSLRDQLSFNYVAWKLGIKYATFSGTCSNNPYFKWFRH